MGVKINVLLIILFILCVIPFIIYLIKKYIFTYAIVTEHKEYFKKKFVNKSRIYPYLKPKQSFLLESFMLKRLENNYECRCKDKKRNHFPVIIKLFPKKKIFYMSKVGIGLHKLKPKEKSIYRQVNFSDQINCIIYNLKKNNIIHNDIWKKNITISEDGTLGLIDFERSELDNQCFPFLKKQKVYFKYKNKNIYDLLETKLKNALINEFNY